MIEQYGAINPPRGALRAKGVLTSGEVVSANSGKFVTSDGSGKLTILNTTDTTIVGWAEVAEGTLSADKDVSVIKDTQVKFRVPFKSGSVASQTALDALVDKTADVDLTTNVQTIDLAAASLYHVIVHGGSYADGYVEVSINPSLKYAVAIS